MKDTFNLTTKLLMPLSVSRNSENPSSIQVSDGYGSSTAQEVMRFMFPECLNSQKKKKNLKWCWSEAQKVAPLVDELKCVSSREPPVFTL